MRLWALGIIVLVAAATTGCSTVAGFEDWGYGPESGEGMGVTWVSSEAYAKYREEVDSWSLLDRTWITCKDFVNDFVDIFSLEVAFGPGLLADVQPTKLGEIGLGYTKTGKIGFRGRAAGFYSEDRREGGLSGLYYRDMDFAAHYGSPALFERPAGIRDFTLRHNDDRHWADIGASAHLVYLGAGAYVSPMQAVDFGLSLVSLPYNLLVRPVANLAGFRPPEIDLADDDTVAQIRRKYNYQYVKPLDGFPPAEKIDELFRY